MMPLEITQYTRPDKPSLSATKLPAKRVVRGGVVPAGSEPVGLQESPKDRWIVIDTNGRTRFWDPRTNDWTYGDDVWEYIMPMVDACKVLESL